MPATFIRWYSLDSGNHPHLTWRRMFASYLRYSTSCVFSLHFSNPVFDIRNCIDWKHPARPRFSYLCVVIKQAITNEKSQTPTSVGRNSIVSSISYLETFAWLAPTAMSLFGSTIQFRRTDELSFVICNRHIAGQRVISNCNQFSLVPPQRWSFTAAFSIEWHHKTCPVIC